MPLPMGFFANSTVFGTMIGMFQCPSDRNIRFRSIQRMRVAYLSGPIGTKGNYGVSWGNTFWGQDMPATAR